MFILVCTYKIYNLLYFYSICIYTYVLKFKHVESKILFKIHIIKAKHMIYKLNL